MTLLRGRITGTLKWTDGGAAVEAVVFTARPRRLTSAADSVIEFPRVVRCSVTSEGLLRGPDGNLGVDLVANDSPGYTPVDWSHQVEVFVKGEPRWTFDISVPAGSEQDLASIAPVNFSEGTPVIVGPPGPAGEPGMGADARSVASRSLLLTQRERTAKGGRVGVGDKAVVVFRWDDWQDRLREDVWPLFRKYGMPAGHVLISRFNTAQPWGAGTTWDDVRDWVQHGVEIWCHGTNHKDPTPDGDDGIYREVVTAKEEIEAQGIKVMGFAPPGTTPVTEAQPFGTKWDSPAAYDTYCGRLIMSHYGISDGYMPGTKWRTMPYSYHHGPAASTITITEGGTTFAQAKAAIDQAVRLGCAIQIFGHAGNIDSEGNMTLAQIEQTLAYVASLRDEGALEVLTPSAAYFATPDTESRLELYKGGSFEGVATGDDRWFGWGSKTVEPTGGPGGGPMLHIPASDTGNLTQEMPEIRSRGFDGEVFMCEMWARSNGGAAAVDVRFQDTHDAAERPTFYRQPVILDEGWVRLRYPFTIPLKTPGMNLSFRRRSGSGNSLDVAGVRVYKV